MQMLCTDPRFRSPMAVSGRSSAVCAVCEQQTDSYATLYCSNGDQLYWCKPCEPYMLVVLPMAKQVKKSSEEGSL